MNQNTWDPGQDTNQGENTGSGWNNSMQDGRIGPLPANINAYNPVADPGAYSIARLIKSSGKVVGYELSNGQRITRDQGVEMAKNGQISGVAVASNQGTEYLRGFADGTEINNLDSLPSITS